MYGSLLCELPKALTGLVSVVDESLESNLGFSGGISDLFHCFLESGVSW